MMKLVICEDEQPQRELMYAYVKEYLKSHNTSFVISSYASGEELLFQEDALGSIDILLLDIQMKEMNGIELAKKMKQKNEHAVIIFITGNTDYIYEGFHLRAMNYLLKPLKKEQLFHCLDEAVKQLRDPQEILLLNVGKELVKLRKNSIYFIESEDHYLNIYHESQCLRMKMNLRDMEEQINLPHFYRLTRSFLINILMISSLSSKALTMDNGAVITMPKGKYREVSALFIKYQIGDAL